MNISSEVDKYKNGSIETISFRDRVCPHCGGTLILVKADIKDKTENLKFHCANCDFECPIYHNKNNEIFPIYDNKIRKFLKTFGKL